MDQNQQQTRANIKDTKPPPHGATKTNAEREPVKKVNETAANAEQPNTQATQSQNHNQPQAFGPCRNRSVVIGGGRLRADFP